MKQTFSFIFLYKSPCAYLFSPVSSRLLKFIILSHIHHLLLYSSSSYTLTFFMSISFTHTYLFYLYSSITIFFSFIFVEDRCIVQETLVFKLL